MNYSYSNELDVTATIEISLRDLDRVIDILKPVALDDDHSHRYRAADLNRAFENVRTRLITRLIQQTRGYMTARDDYDANK
jgi:hypothetical protein